MEKLLGLLFILVIGMTSCNNYKVVDDEDLKGAFILNSSKTFKGYYYEGSDNSYHFFTSKWDFERDRNFKIAVDKLNVNKEYIFKSGGKELSIDFYKEGDIEFAKNEFYKLCVVKQ